MNWKRSVDGYFSLTRKDRIGILVLVGLIGLLFLLPGFQGLVSGPAPRPDTAWVAGIRKLEESQKTRPNRDSSGYDDNAYAYQYDGSVKKSRSVQGRLFYFDPNTLTADGWTELGLRDRTIQTIQNYRNKGGHFRQPQDLQRIYGLRQDEYERLLPFVKIEARKEATLRSSYENSSQPPGKKRSFNYTIVDINTADTTAWIALPGIGSKLATRIVNFREKLGGFYSVEQIAEVYGLADSVYQKIKQYLKLESASVKKININTATIDELKAHPYIRYIIANPLVAYRNQHGPFSAIEEARKLMTMTEDLYKKMAPYLTID